MAEVTTMQPKHKRQPAKKKPETPIESPAPAESTPPQETPPPEAPAHRPAPKTAKERAANATDPPFFRLVESVQKEDWGTRAFIYVYVTEPICNLKQQGGKTYLVRSSGPITDLQQLMEDYGSFQGYMTLNRRKMGAGNSDLIDRYDFEIYNPKYPPKIPQTVWMKDPRNERWAALLPREQPRPDPASVNDPAKMFDVFERMADRVEARYARDEPDPAPDPAEQLSSVADVAEKLLRLANPQGRNSGMEEYLLRRLESAEDRNAKLMDKLFDAKTAPAAAADPMAMFDQIMDRADKIRERVAPETDTAAARNTRMNGWQEFGVQTIQAITNSPAVASLAQGFLLWAASKNGGQHPQPQPTMQPPPNGLPAPTAQQQTPGQPPMKLSAQQFAQHVIPQFISPVMIHLTNRDMDGYDLADVVINSKGLDAYEFARGHGPDLIMQAFALTPFWTPQQNGQPGLSSMEPQLRELITEFCSDPPEDDTAQDAAQPQPAKPINLMDDAEQGTPGE